MVALGCGLREACVGGGQVHVQQQAGPDHVVVGPLDAVARAGAVGRRVAGVAHEHQFRIELELPQGHRALQAGDELGANAQLQALGPHQWVDTLDRIGGRVGIDTYRGATRIVAVEAAPRIDEVLGAGPGAEYQRQLGRGQAGAGLAGVLCHGAFHVEVDLVGAQAHHAAQPGLPLHGAVGIQREAALPHAAFLDGAGAFGAFGGVQAHGPQPVVAHLQADGVEQLMAAQRGVPALAQRTADHAALFGLLELAGPQLVGLLVVGEAEVREQIEPGHDDIGAGLEAAPAVCLLMVGRQAVARGLAAVACIERAVTPDQALFDGALRYLVGRIPLGVVGHRGEARALRLVAQCVAQHTVDAAQVLGVIPGAIVVRGLQGIEQLACRQGARVGHQRAAVAVLARGGGQLPLGQGIDQADARRAGRREIALLGGVGPLAVVDALHELRDQPVQIAVAVAVRVRGHVHRHAVHVGGEVGAVVQVEAAQEVLVGLAAAAVLRDDHARHELQHLGGSQGGPVGQQARVEAALAGGVRAAHRMVVVAFHADWGQGGACWRGDRRHDLGMKLRYQHGDSAREYSETAGSAARCKAVHAAGWEG